MLLIDFPFNYYEAEVVAEAFELSQGRDIYHPLETGPFAGLYAPGFQLVGALLFQIFPASLIGMRLISVVSLIGIAWIYYRLSPSRGLLTQLFALALVGIWHTHLAEFDLHAKPDSFGSFLAILGLGLLLWGAQKKNLGYTMAAGVAISLAVGVKQSMFFMLPPIGLGLILHFKWRQLAAFSAAFGLFTVLLWWFFYAVTGPEIFFYTFVQPGTFRMRYGRIFDTVYGILRGPWLAIAVLLAYRIWAKSKWSMENTLIGLCVWVAWPACVLSASKGGGMANSYQPFFLLLGFWVMYNLPLQALIKRAQYPQASGNYANLLVVFLGFALVWTADINPASSYTIARQRFETRTNYNALAKELASLDGSVYCPDDNYLTIKAGKPNFWGRKWEIETWSAPLNPKRLTYISKSLRADHVVTVQYNGWYNPAELEQILAKSGYRLARKTEMFNDREYRVWSRPSD